MTSLQRRPWSIGAGVFAGLAFAILAFLALITVLPLLPNADLAFLVAAAVLAAICGLTAVACAAIASRRGEATGWSLPVSIAAALCSAIPLVLIAALGVLVVAVSGD